MELLQGSLSGPWAGGGIPSKKLNILCKVWGLYSRGTWGVLPGKDFEDSFIRYSFGMRKTRGGV